MAYQATSALVLALLGIGCAGSGDKGTSGLAVSVPEVTAEQVEKDVMEPAEPAVRMETWRKYDGKIVRWTGSPVEPNTVETRQATANYDLKEPGRHLLVVKVRSIRCQIPAPVDFKPGASVTFTGRLNGTYVDKGGGQDLRLVTISADGLEVR